MTNPPDLTIAAGDATLPHESLMEGSYRLFGGSLLFTMPGLAHYLCYPGGRHIAVEPLTPSRPRDLSAMLIATALPTALWLRGEIVLHAAAAVLPGRRRALALAGASGSGKSTTLRALLAAKAQALSDDTLCLRVRSDGLTEASGLPTATQLRLPTRTPRPIGLEPRYYLPVRPAQQLGSATLGALLVLQPPGAWLSGPGPDPSPDPGPGLRRLIGPSRLQALLANLHRPRVPRLLGQTAGLLPRLAAISRSIAVYSWSPPATCRNDLDGYPLPSLRLLEEVADAGDDLAGGLRDSIRAKPENV